MVETSEQLHGFALRRLGDTVLLLHGGDRIDLDLNLRVHALTSMLRASAPAWVVDLVPAYASLALHIDAEACDSDQDALTRAEAWVRATVATSAVGDTTESGREICIEVRYGGESGPDLERLAKHAGMSEADVVARHTAPHYRVAMLGFAPGFPYLLGLEPALAMPRRAQPRRDVAAGSVGIGGAQTGIYPRAGAGGWQLIGRTESVLFDPAREPCSLLQPGDAVRFVAVDA